MTHLDLWKRYTAHLPTPDHMVELGWYFVVSAALERRVWIGDIDISPLFPNLYVLLIGKPALGKSVLMDCMRRILLGPRLERDPDIPEEAWQIMHQNVMVPTKLTIGADAGSYEKICKTLANSVKTCELETDEPPPRLYAHSSMFFLLGEVKSLLKPSQKHGHERKIGDFLLQTFDCNDYKYDVNREGGTAIVKNSCVNFFGGAVPGVIAEAMRTGVFDDGFMSRFIPIYGQEPRHDEFFLETTEGTKEDMERLIQRVDTLTNLVGRFDITPDARQFVASWYREVHPKTLMTAHPRMLDFYGRRKVFLQKLAMCNAVSDKDDLVIKPADFQKAIDILLPIEKEMEEQYIRIGANAKIQRQEIILAAMRKAGKFLTISEIFNKVKGEFDLMEVTDFVYSLKIQGLITEKNNQFIAGKQ